MSTLQQEIIKRLGVKATIEANTETKNRVDFIKEYLKKHPFVKSLVLGISGGQDSTLAGKLCQIAVDELNQEIGEKKYMFIAVRLPYGLQKDEDDCNRALNFIKPDKVIKVNIKASVDASIRELEDAMGQKVTDFLKGNEKARERMKAQYTIAGMFGGLVVGTDHAAEAITGFYTKYGDGGFDIGPIEGLNKRQGREMLRALGCPQELYAKIPTADLEDNKPQLPDEDALGVKYDEIDDYLEGKQISEKSQEILEKIYNRTEHKRRMPVSILDTWWR